MCVLPNYSASLLSRRLSARRSCAKLPPAVETVAGTLLSRLWRWSLVWVVRMLPECRDNSPARRSRQHELRCSHNSIRAPGPPLGDTLSANRILLAAYK